MDVYELSDTYTREELFNSWSRRWMKIYLLKHVPRNLKWLASERFRRNERDLLQDACVLLLKHPPRRKFELSTVLAKAVMFAVKRKASRIKRKCRIMELRMQSIEEIVCIPSETELTATASERDRSIERALKHLNQRQKEIVVKSFGFGCDETSLAEIGRELKLTRERVRQIQAASLLKLSRLIDENGFPKPLTIVVDPFTYRSKH